MRGTVCLSFVVLAASLVAPEDSPTVSRAAVRAANSVNAFAADLLKRVAASGDNVLFSPHSIAVAMAMARAGAGGETAREIDAALHLPSDSATSFRELTQALEEIPAASERRSDGTSAKTPAYSLSIANGLFTQRGWSFKEAFRSTIRASYAADHQEVDFRGARDLAREAINRWVAERTADRITDIVPPDLPTPDTRLVLANAIHFKAKWLEPFQASMTIDAPFFVKGEDSLTARRMRRTDSYGYAETADAAVVELPYRGGTTSMVVVLPKARDGLDALIGALTPESLAGFTAGLAERRVAVELPKFEFTVPLGLGDTLQAMGIRDAFSSERADFTGITAEKPLFLGAVLHKAFIAVDENGTEAAAATAVLMRTGAARPPDDPTPFVVDHPFLFLIRHTPTGAILFAGRVVDPTAK